MTISSGSVYKWTYQLARNIELPKNKIIKDYHCIFNYYLPLEMIDSGDQIWFQTSNWIQIGFQLEWRKEAYNKSHFCKSPKRHYFSPWKGQTYVITLIEFWSSPDKEINLSVSARAVFTFIWHLSLCLYVYLFFFCLSLLVKVSSAIFATSAWQILPQLKRSLFLPRS